MLSLIEQNSCSEDHMLPKPEIVSLGPFKEKAAKPWPNLFFKGYFGPEEHFVFNFNNQLQKFQCENQTFFYVKAYMLLLSVSKLLPSTKN